MPEEGVEMMGDDVLEQHEGLLVGDRDERGRTRSGPHTREGRVALSGRAITPSSARDSRYRKRWPGRRRAASARKITGESEGEGVALALDEVGDASDDDAVLCQAGSRRSETQRARRSVLADPLVQRRQRLRRVRPSMLGRDTGFDLVVQTGDRT